MRRGKNEIRAGERLEPGRGGSHPMLGMELHSIGTGRPDRIFLSLIVD